MKTIPRTGHDGRGAGDGRRRRTGSPSPTTGCRPCWRPPGWSPTSNTPPGTRSPRAWRSTSGASARSSRSSTSRPVPEGFTVVCRARVIHVDGPVVTFQVEAHDGTEPVARGLHRRRVIDVDRFARRVARKRDA